MEFAILGPLRVVGPDGPIEIKASKQRSLLAMLLLEHRQDVVSAERLMDVLWGEHPPATAPKALQVLISQLRRALGAETIVTRSGGYAIALEDGDLDLQRFNALVARARDAEPERAAELLREALALFRGAPLADAPLLGPAVIEADRISGARLEALEQRIALDLELGRHRDVVGELEGLTAEHAYRERLHAQLMVAHYRSGRQADALEAYRRARHALVEDLGLDPSPELKRLEAAILAQDPSLELDAPAPRPPAAPAAAVFEPAPLPLPPTSLLGRDEELATAAGLLGDSHVRLLTITGPGGIGKSHFALELAHRLAGEFADGARFVALAGLEDASLVATEIAEALGAGEGEAAAVLARHAVLLVIDNFEQVLDAAPELSRLLASSPQSKLVVTSRAALRIQGEHELGMSPLAAAPSAELFLRRARALDSRLQLGPGDEGRIEQICARLDGLPLAIELAAARTKVLKPAAILDRLSRRLDLLSSGPRDAPLRQQTLRAAISWSYDLLDADTQAVFERLGSFAGGFTLELAEALCGLEALDAIASLVEHSLLTSRDGRFELLETIREYAVDRLTKAGTYDEVRRAHMLAYRELVEGGEQGMESAAIGEWLDRLDAERENLRAAMTFAVADGDADTALLFCAELWRYWIWRGNLSEGRELLAAALALDGGAAALRQRALNGAGAVAGEQGDFELARQLFERALALEVADDNRAARISGNLGNLALYRHDYDEAITRFDAGVELMRSLDHARGLSLMLQNLGIAHAEAGHRERAIELLDESVTVARRAGDPGHVSSTLRTLARLLLDADEPGPALAMLHEAMELSRGLNERPGLTESLETLSAVALRQGDPRTAALLIGAAGALRTAAGGIRQPDEDAWVQRIVAELREALGDEGFAEAEAVGSQLDLADAVARALALSAR